MKRVLALWLLGLLISVQVFAQDRKLSGTVTDATTGEALIGVNVTGKGTTTGTVTDLDGKYNLDLPKEVTTLVFSYVGYTTVEKPILSLVTDVKMSVEGEQIADVVVIGVIPQREKRSTSFATQTISSDDLNKTATNVFTALQGKTAGVRISSTSGQVGSSTRIVIRGESSITQGNNALIVVDGIPVNNTATGDDDFINSYTDYGNHGLDFNNEDIENVTVLSGPAAIALYGSRGASGVILITTKSGKAKKGESNFKVTVNSGVTFDQAYVQLKRQNQFGEGYYPVGIVPGENFSWGPAFDGRDRVWTAPTVTPSGTAQLIRPYSLVKDNINQFFDLGSTYNNNLALEGGNDKFNYYLSIGNLNNKGIFPYAYYKRTNVTFNGTGHLSEKLTTSFGLKYSYINEDAKNSGREFFNPYQAAIQTPVNIPVRELRDFNSPFYNLDGYYGSYTPNPFYVAANYKNESRSHNFLGSFQLDWKVIDGLTFTARVGDNIVTQEIENKIPKYAYTVDDFNPDNFGGNRDLNIGRYGITDQTFNDLSVDASGTYDKEVVKNLKITVTAGVSSYSKKFSQVSSTTAGGLVVPDFYNLSNSQEAALTTNQYTKYELLGVFTNANIGYKNMLFAEYSARNDWSSTLPKGSNGFFYQAGGLSFVPTELFKTPNKWLNYLKIRGNAGTSGKDAPLYKLQSIFISNPDYSADYAYAVRFPFATPGGTVTGFTTGNNIGNPALKPELTFLWEAGADIGLFDDRLKINYTYYQKTSKDLIVDVSLPASSGYTTTTQNIGKVSNKGHELVVTGTPVRDMKGFNWDVRFTFTKNVNKVIKVSDDNDEKAIGGSTGAGIVAKEGLPLGTFKVFDYERDSLGRVVVDNAGYPIAATTQIYAGSYQPKYQMGVGTTLSYKGLAFDIQFDISEGGKFYAGTQEISEFNGTAITTLMNDRLPMIYPNSVVHNADGTYTENTQAFIDPYPLFRDVPTLFYIKDASYIKLREASVSYTLQKKVFKHSPLTGVTISAVGRNLKFWLAKENVFADPESNASGLNSNESAFEAGTTPPFRSYGFNLRLQF